MRLGPLPAVRRAAAALELAIVTPLFLILLFGLWEIGRAVDVQQVINNAAREGGRQASTAKYTEEEIAGVVLDYLTNAGLPTRDASDNPNVSVTIEVLDTNGNVVALPLRGAAQMTHVRIRVSYPYANVRWAVSSMFIPAEAALAVQADWFVTADVPISVPVTIPSSPLP